MEAVDLGSTMRSIHWVAGTVGVAPWQYLGSGTLAVPWVRCHGNLVAVPRGTVPWRYRGSIVAVWQYQEGGAVGVVPWWYRGGTVAVPWKRHFGGGGTMAVTRQYHEGGTVAVVRQYHSGTVVLW